MTTELRTIARVTWNTLGNNGLPESQMWAFRGEHTAEHLSEIVARQDLPRAIFGAPVVDNLRIVPVEIAESEPETRPSLNNDPDEDLF